MTKSCAVVMSPLDFVGLGAKDPGLQGLVHKVDVINEGQRVDFNTAWIFVYSPQWSKTSELVCMNLRLIFSVKKG